VDEAKRKTLLSVLSPIEWDLLRASFKAGVGHIVAQSVGHSDYVLSDAAKVQEVLKSLLEHDETQKELKAQLKGRQAPS